jgi:hypothetical protein
MTKCKCGSTVFSVKMVTTKNVRVTTVSGYPELLPTTEGSSNCEYTSVFVCLDCKTGYFYVGLYEDNSSPDTKRCSCGNTQFSAKQVCYHDIIVSSDNIFNKDMGISDVERPYGSYTCTVCSTEYEELDELDELPINQAIRYRAG